MRSILEIVVLAAALVGGFFIGEAEAGFFNQGEGAILAHYVTPSSVAGSSAAIVVDVSNTASWPHKSAAWANVLGVDVVIDQVAAGTSTVKLGVVTSINASSGTVSWFATFDNTLNVSNTNKSQRRWYDPSLVKARVLSGSTPDFVTNDRTTITPVNGRPLLFQNDVSLLTTLGGAAVFPAVGDIVAEFDSTSASPAKFDISLFYTTEP